MSQPPFFDTGVPTNRSSFVGWDTLCGSLRRASLSQSNVGGAR